MVHMAHSCLATQCSIKEQTIFNKRAKISRIPYIENKQPLEKYNKKCNHWCIIVPFAALTLIQYASTRQMEQNKTITCSMSYSYNLECTILEAQHSGVRKLSEHGLCFTLILVLYVSTAETTIRNLHVVPSEEIQPSDANP